MTGYRQIPKESELTDDPFRSFLLTRLAQRVLIGTGLTGTDQGFHPVDGFRPTHSVNPNALPRHFVTFADNSARLVIAFVGGAFVVVPMVVMSLDRSETKCLVTTSASVLLFILFISFVVRASDKTTLAAATTYAAVLVVFVGTSLPPVGPTA
jgi:hypothetical protein